jgi:hypothetical protein
MFSREKVRPKIVRLTGRKKVEAFEHPQKLSQAERSQQLRRRSDNNCQISCGE